MKPSRREFVAAAGSTLGAMAASPSRDIPVRDGIPRVDFHAHPEAGMTVEKALAISHERGVKFGLVQHAGAANGNPELVTTDEGLTAWMRAVEGKPVFAGMQAEGMDWMSAFSKATIAKLDYVLSDALTMPDETGKPVKLWTPAFHTDDAQRFMDRYVDFHLEVMSREPIDILANPTFLPQVLEPQFEQLWTEKRMRKIIDCASKYGIAIEINSRYRVPRLPFLRMAKDAGLVFSFGSNAHNAEEIGNIDYGVEMYRKLELSMNRFFHPAEAGKKPIERRGRGVTAGV